VTLPLKEDLDVFFSDFAVDAETGTGTIKVLFSKNYKAMSVHSNEVESYGPAATCKTSDVQDAIAGDEIVIEDTSYFVKEIQDEGHGMTKLFLSEDPVR
jgi:hypothetical protein